MKRFAVAIIVVSLLVVLALALTSCAKKAAPEEEGLGMAPAVEEGRDVGPGAPSATEAGEKPEAATAEGEKEEQAVESEQAEGKHEEAAENEGEEKHEEGAEANAEQSVKLPPETMEGKEVELTDANFDDIINQKGVVALVDFWAEWCGPCLQQGPIVEELAKEYKGKVIVGKVNVDNNEQLSSRFGINAIPTLIVFKDGKEVDRAVGLHQKDYLQKMIERALGG